MKKLSIALTLLLCVSAFADAAYVAPVSPVRFRQNHDYQILSYILLDRPLGPKAEVYVNGECADMEQTSRADSVLVWLPMFGNEMRMTVKDGKEMVMDRTVMPFVPSDWGYFRNGTIHIIQSSHQDIGWMDTPERCREDRIENIILPALEMMEKNPSFRFEMEQTLNLMEFLDEYPERKDEIADLYKAGRFTWGATFNQPYEGLSSGEQLVRQAYYGRKWVLDNFPGADDKVANNMDVPGRTWQMPQILAKSGIENLFISRMAEGLYDWYAPDGSKILTFSPGNYGWPSLMWKFFDDDAPTAMHKLHHRTQLWEEYYKRHKIPPHYAILMSCDATKPVDYQPVVDEWNRIVRTAGIDLPQLKMSTSEEFFNAVRGEETSFRKIEGERPDLWLYIHGPAHYEATCYKREASVLLPAAESFTALSLWRDSRLEEYPHDLFDRAWMASIYPDHGLGGKNGHITDAVFEDSLRVGRDLGRELLNASLEDIAADIDTPQGNLVVFNGLTWLRTRTLSVDISSKDASVLNEEGREVPSQVVRTEEGYRLTFLASDIPAMGYRCFRVREGRRGRSGAPEVLLSDNTFENRYYKAVLGDGGIVSLYDKESGKEVVHTSKFACGDIIEAGYTGNGAGEFTRIQDLTPGDILTLSSMPADWKLTETGSVFSRFVNRQTTGHADVVQIITFHHSDKKIDFDVVLENFDGEHNRQYRIAFPLNMMAESEIHYEVPMGVAGVGKDELGMQPGGWAWGGTYVHHPEDTHPREIQNFISASGNGMGVTMSSCVAVADWVDPSREMASYPVLQGILLSSHKSCHVEGNWYEQKGTHRFHFSLTSHPEGWKNGYHFGVGENHPLYMVRKSGGAGTLSENHSFLDVSDPFVGISVMKKSDKGTDIIIRLVEMEGKDKEVVLTLPEGVKGVVRTNLIEQEEEPLEISGKVLTLKLGHHAIETFKLLL